MSEPKQQDKAFDISKWVVWEAYQRVKANKGAAGVDDVSIAEFEQERDKHLYRIWNRMSSGSYFPPPVKAVEIPKPGVRECESWVYPLSRIGSRRRWPGCIWSRSWNRCFTRTPMGIVRSGPR